MAAVDWEQPLSTLIRDGTKMAHHDAQSSPGQRMLFDGQLSRDTYAKYLLMLWHVYSSLEQALERHAAHPALAPTYNPTLFARCPALTSDISYYLQTPPASWKSHPFYKEVLAEMPKPLTAYLDRLRTISESGDPCLLLAHAYVRYLGDLSGGQIVARSITKAYGLDENSHRGKEFYVFKELKTNEVANLGEIKRIKEWFKEGMDAAGALGQDTKAKVLDEALRTFALNVDLFTVMVDEESKIKENSEHVGRNSEISSKLRLVNGRWILVQVLGLAFGAIVLARFMLFG